MNADARPPEWAVWILTSILPYRDRDAVPGDLLEHYRLEQLGRRGRVRADLWYVGQVVSHCWKSIRVAVFMFATAFVLHDTVNALFYPGLTSTRLETAFVAAVCAGFGFFSTIAGRRTGSVAGALLTTVAAQAGAWLIMGAWWAATLYPFAHVMRDSPYWVQAWQYRPNDLSFERWLLEDNLGAFVIGGGVGLAASALSGVAGGFVGRALRMRVE
jgi:hypothetical protein